MSADPKNDSPKMSFQASPKIEPPISTTSKTSSEAVLAWRKKMNGSTLSNQEKIEATKVLIKLRQVQEKNKALFNKLGLGHDGHPIKKREA